MKVMGIAIAISGTEKSKAGMARLSKGLQSRLHRYSPKQQYRIMVLLLAAGAFACATVALTSIGQDQDILSPMPEPELPVLPAYRDSSDVENLKPKIDEEQAQ